MGKIPLFHESDQEEEKEEIEFKTNRSYAKHYDEFRKKEVLGQLKNLESDGESSSSEDETTDEEVVDADFDKEFFRTLAYLKRRDPEKYEEKPSFFENVKPVEEVALEKRKKKEKPMTLKDYERKVILEKGGVYEDEDENPRQQPRAESPSLVQQQEQIKDEIRRALSKIDTDDEEDEQEEKAGLLKERSKSKEEQDREQADYLSWLADKKAKQVPSEEVKPLEPLKEFWSSKSLSKEDAFLKDYILNKRFVDNTGEAPTYDDIVATSEDEEELEKQEEYERQYNFRFEEPDAEFIKRYPRNVEESVRIERNKRKEQRQALKERKQREKEQQKRELEELKAIKLQEIKDRIQKLKDIAATENMTLNEEELESDFDPDEHDRRMQRMFDDDYYGVDEGDQKPEFPDLDEELGIENYDREKVDTDEQEQNDDGPYCEDDDFVMDADFEENQKKKKKDKKNLEEELLEATGSKKKKKGKKMSKFAEVLKKEKPLFDPEDEKTYGEYIDEYYKLDYEDIIGDTPCRFRYVETVPNDFGLTVEEILMANTRELNRWASVKKTVQIRPKYSEISEIEVYKRKAQNEELKKKILPSLYAPQEEHSEEEDEIKQKKVNTITKLDDQDSVENPETVPVESKKKKKKKKKPAVEESSTQKEKLDVTEETVETKETKEENRKSKKKHKNTENTEEHEETKTDEKPEEHTETEQKKSKKRKRENDEPAASEEPHSKKKHHQKKFNKDHKHKGHFESNQAPTNVIDSRLRAFGINPKKFHNKLKYGNQGKQPTATAAGAEQHRNGNRHKGQNQRGKFGNKGGKFKNKHWNKK